MQKSGMLYEGTHRQEKLRDGKTFYDVAVYAILKEDWK
jgi:ribosomal-protein-alanine N-acetyltransferase